MYNSIIYYASWNTKKRTINIWKKLCAWRHNMPPPPAVGTIFAFIRQAAPVPACWLFKISATSWPLTFWPWKWCPSHVRATWATPVPILVFLGLSVLELGPMYATDVRQKSDKSERVLPLEFTDIFHAYSHHTVWTLLSVSICFVKILSRSFIVCI